MGLAQDAGLRLRRAATYAAAPVARLGYVPTRRFTIFCPPRTGSDLLVSLLDAHPRVRCDGEILRTPIPRPFSWFDGRSAITRWHGSSVWGCKIVSRDLRWAPEHYGSGHDFLSRLDDLDYRILYLRRRDCLLQALSLVHASRTQYHFTVDDDVRFEPMTVDPVQLLGCLYILEEEAEAAEAAVQGLPRVELWYEDDLLTADRQQATLDRLTDELSIERIRAETRVVAGAPPTLRERVANLEEVADLVGRTRFGRYLEPLG